MQLSNDLPGITVTKEKGISDEVHAFLTSIAWGSDGAVYQRHDLSERLYSLPDPYLILLRDAVAIAGTAVFNKRIGYIGNTPLPFFYVCFFAASPRIRGRGLIKQFGASFMTRIREDESTPAVYMGVIERGNHSSYKVAQNAGYNTISLLKTVGFSRFFPKKDPRCRRALPEEYATIKERLTATYSYHALVHFTHLFMRGDYYVLAENGQLIAGVQVHPARWTIKKMPGLLGKAIMHILPHIPLIKRLYNPKDFRFLTFEGVFYPDNRIDVLHRLLSAVLADKQHHTALFFLDERSPLYEALLQHGKLGLVHTFTKGNDARIVASFAQVDRHTAEELTAKPWYTTGFDYI